MKSFPTEEQTILFKGPVGDIEMLLTPVSHENARSVTAIICHPHPLFGGTMTNKVVTTLARALSDVGVKTIRFNFRGVGKSAGVHDHGKGEVEDVIAIARWVKEISPHDALWLAGFSFGGYVAAQAGARLSIEKLVTVAPQASRFVENPLPPVTIPWLVVQGELDEVVPPAEVYAWIDSLEPKPTLVKLLQAGHFFHGQLMQLRRVLGEFLS